MIIDYRNYALLLFDKILNFIKETNITNTYEIYGKRNIYWR